MQYKLSKQDLREPVAKYTSTNVNTLLPSKTVTEALASLRGKKLGDKCRFSYLWGHCQKQAFVNSRGNILVNLL